MSETEQQRKEREHQEDLQRLRDFRPIDDDFMRCLFKDNVPLAELVLRIITGKKDLVIIDCQTQKDMKRLAGARSICLDAYGTDSENKKYDCEIREPSRTAQDTIPVYWILRLWMQGRNLMNCRTLIPFSSRKKIFMEKVNHCM